MENQCTNNPHECITLARVEALEKRMDRAGDTHKEFFDRIRALEQDSAVQEERYNTIIEKLDSLTATVADVTSKPARRWESIVDKSVRAVLAAVIAFQLPRRADKMQRAGTRRTLVIGHMCWRRPTAGRTAISRGPAWRGICSA